jgi:hypothetical protein
MRVVECVSELTAGAARSTTQIQYYIASAHTKPGSDPGTSRDVSTDTVGNLCVKFHVYASHPYSALTVREISEILSKTLVYNGLRDHAFPAQRRGRTISVPLAEPKRILQEELVQVPGNSGRS